MFEESDLQAFTILGGKRIHFKVWHLCCCLLYTSKKLEEEIAAAKVKEQQYNIEKGKLEVANPKLISDLEDVYKRQARFRHTVQNIPDISRPSKREYQIIIQFLS